MFMKIKHPLKEGDKFTAGVALIPEYYEQDGTLTEVTGIPEVAAGGQGGLLDVAISPDFKRSRTVYLSYAQPRADGNGTAVARMQLADDGASVDNVMVLFEQRPSYDGDKHFGSRIVPAPDGTLFVTLGERSDVPIRDSAQDMGNHLGKLVRIGRTGDVPDDNPFIDQQGTVLACGTCIKSRNQKESDACPISTMIDCLNMVEWADKVITF